MNQDQLKQAVAQAAVDHVLPHLDNKSIIGVSTGSTTNFFIGAPVRHEAEFDGAVASLETIVRRLRERGTLAYELDTVSRLELYVDGVDESNERLELIKGDDAALIREKTVIVVVKTSIYIADANKLVPIFDRFPLPVEVTPVARSHVINQLVKLGSDPVYREGALADNGSTIPDVHSLHIDSPMELGERISAIIDVVTNDLFVTHPADLLLLSTVDGAKALEA